MSMEAAKQKAWAEFVEETGFYHKSMPPTSNWNAGFDKGWNAAREWVPTSQRLPDKNSNYLVSLRNGQVHVDNYIRFDIDLSPAGFQYVEVVAWMPLPEPYISPQITDQST